MDAITRGIVSACMTVIAATVLCLIDPVFARYNEKDELDVIGTRACRQF